MLGLATVLLALLSFFFLLFWTTDRHQRLVNGREGEPNPRGKKPMVDGSIPLSPDGWAVQDRVFLRGGSEYSDSCVSRIAIAYLCEGERLFLSQRDGRAGIAILNHRRLPVGKLVPTSPHYALVAGRLAAGETVNVWVSDWGARKGFYCELTAEYYSKQDTAEVTVSDQQQERPSFMSSVVFFPTHDLVAVEQFYSGRLGFVVRHQTSASLIVDTGYGYLGFADYGDEQELATGCCISINCRDRSAVDVAYRLLRKDSIILAPPQAHPIFPVYSFFMNDPNGYTLEVQVIE